MENGFKGKDRKTISDPVTRMGNNLDDGRLYLSLFTNRFDELPDNFFWTNSMYHKFKKEILSSIDIYNIKEEIVLNVYGTNIMSKEDEKGLFLEGFRRYIKTSYISMRKQLFARLSLIVLFLLLGISLVYINVCEPFDLPDLLTGCLEVSSWVLIWEFVHFWAFEFQMHFKGLRRLKQIYSMEFRFFSWE